MQVLPSQNAVLFLLLFASFPVYRAQQCELSFGSITGPINQPGLVSGQPATMTFDNCEWLPAVNTSQLCCSYVSTSNPSNPRPLALIAIEAIAIPTFRLSLTSIPPAPLVDVTITVDCAVLDTASITVQEGPATQSNSVPYNFTYDGISPCTFYFENFTYCPADSGSHGSSSSSSSSFSSSSSPSSFSSSDPGDESSNSQEGQKLPVSVDLVRNSPDLILSSVEAPGFQVLASYGTFVAKGTGEIIGSGDTWMKLPDRITKEGNVEHTAILHLNTSSLSISHVVLTTEQMLEVIPGFNVTLTSGPSVKTSVLVQRWPFVSPSSGFTWNIALRLVSEASFQAPSCVTTESAVECTSKTNTPVQVVAALILKALVDDQLLQVPFTHTIDAEGLIHFQFQLPTFTNSCFIDPGWCFLQPTWFLL
ncbi:hypothetical protein QOT17_014570 [Balamuthia mandrillaris]